MRKQMLFAASENNEYTKKIIAMYGHDEARQQEIRDLIASYEKKRTSSQLSFELIAEFLVKHNTNRKKTDQREVKRFMYRLKNILDNTKNKTLIELRTFGQLTNACKKDPTLNERAKLPKDSVKWLFAALKQPDRVFKEIHEKLSEETKQLVEKLNIPVDFHARHIIFDEHPHCHFQPLLKSLKDRTITAQQLIFLMENFWGFDVIAWRFSSEKDQRPLGQTTQTESDIYLYKQFMEKLEKIKDSTPEELKELTLDGLLPSVDI